MEFNEATVYRMETIALRVQRKDFWGICDLITSTIRMVQDATGLTYREATNILHAEMIARHGVNID